MWLIKQKAVHYGTEKNLSKIQKFEELNPNMVDAKMLKINKKKKFENRFWKDHFAVFATEL